MRYGSAAVSAVLLICCHSRAPIVEAAQNPPDSIEIAFVANAEGGDVSLVDVSARRVVATIDINPDDAVVQRAGAPNYAQDTDTSPDGRTLFVSRGYLGDVAAFEIATGRLLWRRSLDTTRADHMTITPDGRWLFVSALVHNRVDRIDTKTGEVTGSFVSGVYPHDNQISADGRQVINSSLGDMTVPVARRDSVAEPGEKSGYAYQLTVADIASMKVVRRIRMPVGVRPWHMQPGGGEFYAQTSNSHSVVAFSYPEGKEIRRLELPVPQGISAADYDFEAPHHGLAMSHDGSVLCLAGRGADYAALVKAPGLELIATIPVGDAPGWSAMADNDRLCILANTRDDTVSFISIAAAKEVLRLPAGDGPKHITVARIPVEVIAAAAEGQRLLAESFVSLQQLDD
jgi:6-phosphogluconolactonase (cycloisomerase 2 family)